MIKRYEYLSLVKDLENSKFNLFLRSFKKFNLLNFVKINAFIFLPKKIVLKFIDNV